MPKQIHLDDQVFELKEAAAFIRMSPDWLERSDVPRSRMGRRILFLKSELLAYVAAHLTHSSEDAA